MARFKPVGKKRTTLKTLAKQGQDYWRSHCQVSAAEDADAEDAAAEDAAAGTAAPVTAPAHDAIVPPAGSLETDAPSGISAPSATTATTTVIAAATSSVTGANMPDFAAATCSAAAGVPPPEKGSSKAKKHAKGSASSAIEAPVVSVGAASSTANASHSAPFTADAATTVMEPIQQSSCCAAAQTAMAVLRYILYDFIYTNLYVLCFCMNSYIFIHL